MAIPYGKAIVSKKLKSDQVKSPAKNNKMAKSRSSSTKAVAEDEENELDYPGKGNQPKGSKQKSAKNKANKERNLSSGRMQF